MMDPESQESPAVLLSQSGATAVVPPATRGLAVAVACVTLASLTPGIGPNLVTLLALVPQSTVGKFWNVLTASLIEVFPPAALVTVPALALLGRWVEPVWGSREFALFAACVSVSSAVATFFVTTAAYAVTREQSYVFQPVGGLSAVVAGLFVAIKQVIPDFVVAGAFRANFLPLILASLLCFATAAKIMPLGTLVFAIAGMQSAYVYLRFYQKREHGRGDPADSFAFSTFFPNPVAPIFAVLASVTFFVCRPFLFVTRYQVAMGGGGEKDSLPVNSADPIDAERRRQRALRLLDERLKSNVSDSSAKEQAV
jgi:membrane associated rhomboid family serine protease